MCETEVSKVGNALFLVVSWGLCRFLIDETSSSLGSVCRFPWANLLLTCCMSSIWRSNRGFSLHLGNIRCEDFFLFGHRPAHLADGGERARRLNQRNRNETEENAKHDFILVITFPKTKKTKRTFWKWRKSCYVFLRFLLFFRFWEIPFQGTARARPSTAADDVGGQGAP